MADAARFRELADQLDLAGKEMRDAWLKDRGFARQWHGFIRVGGEYMGTPIVQIEYEDLASLFRVAANVAETALNKGAADAK